MWTVAARSGAAAAAFSRVLSLRPPLIRNIPFVRNSSHGVWTYRAPPPEPTRNKLIACELLGGLLWWWVLWHCFTEPQHLFGEYPEIKPEEWTDEELGIPPDSEGPALRSTAKDEKIKVVYKVF